MNSVTNSGELISNFLAISGDDTMVSNSRLRILYAEDHADTREFVTFVLTRNNCEVVTVDNYDHALLLARKDSFDLYILDNWLPDKSGVDLCLRLREIDPKTPILFYSGAALETDKTIALSSGAQAYITKPADCDELVAAVFQLTGTSQANQSQMVSFR